MYYTVKEGHCYDVEFFDCCVNGVFTARLIEIKPDPNDEDGEWPILVFDNGVTLYGHNGQVSFTPTVEPEVPR